MSRFLFFIVFTTLSLWAFPKNEKVPGGMVLLKLGHGELPAPVVTYGEEKALVIRDAGKGWLAFIGVPLDAQPGEAHINIIFDGNPAYSETISLHSKKYKSQYITLKSNKRVDLSQEDLDRHYREKKNVTQALDQYSQIERPDIDFALPVKGRISGTFGLKRFYNQKPRSPHKGLDIAAKKGTPIKAASGGTVLINEDLFFNGNTVIIDHGQGLMTMYCHMDSISVEEGTVVSKGDIIGTVGSTGRSTGAHLHFGIYLSGTWINPELFIGEKL